MDLFRRKPSIKVVERSATALTLEEWRSQPHLIKAAREVVTSQTFQAMLDVLRNVHYVNYSLPTDASIEQRAITQARGEGYTSCMNNLLAMAEPPGRTRGDLEPTFEAQENELTTEKLEQNQ